MNRRIFSLPISIHKRKNYIIILFIIQYVKMLKFGRFPGLLTCIFYTKTIVDIRLKRWYSVPCIEVAGFISNPADAQGRR